MTDDLVAKASDMTTCELVAILRIGHHPMMTTLAGVQHDERCLAAADRIEALEAENARLREAERAAWEPPPEAERPDRFKCLGFLLGRWHFISWHPKWGWLDESNTIRSPKIFAPLPPTPEARHD